MTTPAGWYADPSGQFEQRYWDGATWTDHVSAQGQQGTSPLAPAAPEQVNVGRAAAPEHIAKQVQQQANLAPVGGGGGTIFSEPILVVNQKAKLIELTNEYAVFDSNGRQLGSVVQVGQSALKKVVRAVSSYDQFFTHKLEVRDMHGQVLMRLTRPAKLLKSKVIVELPNGQQVGTIVQKNAIGKIRFGFDVNGREIGGINAENWRAWNFNITDETGAQVARITKTFEGIAKTMFTSADNYVIQINRPLEDPLRTLVVASALCVDTALKQDSRGLG